MCERLCVSALTSEETRQNPIENDQTMRTTNCSRERNLAKIHIQQKARPNVAFATGNFARLIKAPLVARNPVLIRSRQDI
jgi:hypothetical protein